ncbi:MAG: FAD-linked oxidase C-terminal domain-containing protein, partial [Deltaproteobacteria bacterium]
AAIRLLRFVLVDSGVNDSLEASGASTPSRGGFEFRIELAGTQRVLSRCEKELREIATRAGETIRLIAPEEAEDLWCRLGDIHSEVAQSPNGWLLKVSLPMSKVEDFFGKARRLLESKTPLAKFHADPLAGSVGIQLCAESRESVLEDSVMELRNLAGELGGSLVVEIAPAAAQGKVDAWGACGNDFDVMRKVKEALDPKGVLSPGRFVGGL